MKKDTDQGDCSEGNRPSERKPAKTHPAEIKTNRQSENPTQGLAIEYRMQIKGSQLIPSQSPFFITDQSHLSPVGDPHVTTDQHAHMQYYFPFDQALGNLSHPDSSASLSLAVDPSKSGIRSSDRFCFNLVHGDRTKPSSLGAPFDAGCSIFSFTQSTQSAMAVTNVQY